MTSESPTRMRPSSEAIFYGLLLCVSSLFIFAGSTTKGSASRIEGDDPFGKFLGVGVPIVLVVICVAALGGLVVFGGPVWRSKVSRAHLVVEGQGWLDLGEVCIRRNDAFLARAYAEGTSKSECQITVKVIQKRSAEAVSVATEHLL